MHQTKKGNQWHFGMKARIGSDADLGLMHTVTTKAANAHDITHASELLHGQETDVFADSGYRGVEKREEIETKHLDVNWHIAMMQGKRRAMDKNTPMDAILDKLEQTKARIRAKVEHPFRVIKRQFGYVKIKYLLLAKNTANLMTLFALSNIWTPPKRLLNMGCRRRTPSGSVFGRRQQWGFRHECARKLSKGRERGCKRSKTTLPTPKDVSI